MDEQLPVTLVTGFLGAGKTTFLNHLLADAHGARLAVLVNEFDELGIDRDLIRNVQGQLVEMNNGCICCSVESDLKTAVLELLGSGRELDGLVIETTGLAAPGPIAAAFFADPLLCEATRLDAIVTLVDAYHVRQQLGLKADARHAGQIPEALAQIAHADVLLLNKTDLVEPAELAELVSELRAVNGMAPVIPIQHGVVPLEAVLHLRAFEMERERVPAELHGHAHDQEVGSISFRFEEAFDQVQLNTFFCQLLREQGEQIYRCKGLVHVAQLDEPLVFQGVGSLFATGPGTPWAPTERRESRMVFIGKQLDRAAIARGLTACFVAYRG